MSQWEPVASHYHYSYFFHEASVSFSCSVTEQTEGILVSHGRAVCYSESEPVGDPFRTSLSDEQALITRPFPLS